MSESMIERVARAAHAKAYETRGSKTVLGPDWLAVAQAAIEAMREPTERMKESGYRVAISEFYELPDETKIDQARRRLTEASYGAMIDAALIYPAGSADRAGVPMARD